MQPNFNQESFKKGEQFERYVEEVIFPEAHYELIYKTSDSQQNTRRYARKSMEPDFQFRCRVSGKLFSVEAKWRAKPYKDQYEVLSEKQFNSFPKLHSDEIPIFVVFGYGGQAYKPDFVSLIPIMDIHAPKISPAEVHSFNIEKTYYPPSNFTFQKTENSPKHKKKEPQENENEVFQKESKNIKTYVLAAIGVLAIFISIYSFAFSNSITDLPPEERLQITVEEYYQDMNSNQIEKLPEYLSSNVESWYGTPNMTASQILKDAKNHRARYPYSTTEINWNSFKVIRQEDGNYMASYDMIYKRKKNIYDDYTIINLHILSIWDENFKLRSIREL